MVSVQRSEKIHKTSASQTKSRVLLWGCPWVLAGMNEVCKGTHRNCRMGWGECRWVCVQWREVQLVNNLTSILKTWKQTQIMEANANFSSNFRTKYIKVIFCLEQAFLESTNSCSLGETFQIYLIQRLYYTGKKIKVIYQATGIQIIWLPGFIWVIAH